MPVYIRKLMVIFAVACLLNLCVAVVFGYNSEVTAYDSNNATLSYTLVSTHFTHHSPSHLINNLLALGLLLVLFPSRISTLLYSFSTCIISVAIYVLLVEVQSFLGFSAMLYCLPGCYLVPCIFEKKYAEASTILMILYIYLYILIPMTTEKNTLWQPMTEAHLIGFISGVVSALLTIKIHNHNDLNPIST